LDGNAKFIEDLRSGVNGSRIPARWTVNVATVRHGDTLRKIEAIDTSLFPRMQWEIVIDSFLEHLRDPEWSLEHLQYGRLIHSFANKQESLQPGFFFF
jgi:hypothetical protein